jgi:hypothetical protein
MLTILLLAALVIFTIVFACTAGAVASIIVVFFGDVLLVTLIAMGIVKIHKHFKNKKKK